VRSGSKCREQLLTPSVIENRFAEGLEAILLQLDLARAGRYVNRGLLAAIRPVTVTRFRPPARRRSVRSLSAPRRPRRLELEDHGGRADKSMASRRLRQVERSAGGVTLFLSCSPAVARCRPTVQAEHEVGSCLSGCDTQGSVQRRDFACNIEGETGGGKST